MLGKQLDQRGLWEADHLDLDLVSRDSFYGLLAGLRVQLFREEDFAALYCRNSGRSSVPPSLLSAALLLQAHVRVSDAEAHHRATADLSWKVVLGVEVRLFALSTPQHFRAQLFLNAQMPELFRRILELARTRGLLWGRSLKVALDKTPNWGRGPWLCPVPGGQSQGQRGDRLGCALGARAAASVLTATRPPSRWTPRTGGHRN